MKDNFIYGDALVCSKCERTVDYINLDKGCCLWCLGINHQNKEQEKLRQLLQYGRHKTMHQHFMTPFKSQICFKKKEGFKIE